MKRFAISSLTLLFLVLAGTSALQAQATRTRVSGGGAWAKLMTRADQARIAASAGETLGGLGCP